MTPITQKVDRLVRYSGVNLASTIVDYSFFLALTHFFGDPTLQSVVAYMLATMLNYTLSKNFVFVGDMSHKSEHRLFVEFFCTGLLGLVLTAAVISLATGILSVTPFAAKTASVLICFVVLYVVRSRFVFNDNATSPAAA